MSGHKDKVCLLQLDEWDEIRKGISVCVLDFNLHLSHAITSIPVAASFTGPESPYRNSNAALSNNRRRERDSCGTGCRVAPT